MAQIYACVLSSLFMSLIKDVHTWGFISIAFLWLKIDDTCKKFYTRYFFRKGKIMTINVDKQIRIVQFRKLWVSFRCVVTY